jgi:hypothetical protein
MTLLPVVAADIAYQEGATLFIPVSSPIASLYDAMAAEALPRDCRYVKADIHTQDALSMSTHLEGPTAHGLHTTGTALCTVLCGWFG